MRVYTDSQITSAEGSTCASISSLMLAWSRNGAGCVEADGEFAGAAAEADVAASREQPASRSTIEARAQVKKRTTSSLSAVLADLRVRARNGHASRLIVRHADYNTHGGMAVGHVRGVLECKI